MVKKKKGRGRGGGGPRGRVERGLTTKQKKKKDDSSFFSFFTFSTRICPRLHRPSSGAQEGSRESSPREQEGAGRARLPRRRELGNERTLPFFPAGASIIFVASPVARDLDSLSAATPKRRQSSKRQKKEKGISLPVRRRLSAVRFSPRQRVPCARTRARARETLCGVTARRAAEVKKRKKQVVDGSNNNQTSFPSWRRWTASRTRRRRSSASRRSSLASWTPTLW